VQGGGLRWGVILQASVCVCVCLCLSAFSTGFTVCWSKAQCSVLSAQASPCSVLAERPPTTTLLPALTSLLSVLAERPPTTVLPALASRLAVITNRAPTTALHALASRLAVLAVVDLNPNSFGVYERRCFPHTPNVIGLPQRAAFILLMEALEEHPFALPCQHSSPLFKFFRN
jgi:hypothetical protein